MQVVVIYNVGEFNILSVGEQNFQGILYLKKTVLLVAYPVYTLRDFS